MTFIKSFLENWKPGVPKGILPLLAAVTWIGSAIVLNLISSVWLKKANAHEAFLAVAAGFLGALVIHHFGFLRIVNKNLGRILAMAEGRRCAFSFMPWKSYLLIPLMIILGVILRHSPVPRLYLAVLYIAIGTALFLSSLRYLRHALQAMRNTGGSESCGPDDEAPPSSQAGVPQSASKEVRRRNYDHRRPQRDQNR